MIELLIVFGVVSILLLLYAFVPGYWVAVVVLALVVLGGVYGVGGIFTRIRDALRSARRYLGRE